MQRKHTEKTRSNVLAAHSSGKSVTRISEEFNVPRSTIYYWIKMNKNLKLKNGNEVTVREFFELQRDMKK